MKNNDPVIVIDSALSEETLKVYRENFASKPYDIRWRDYQYGASNDMFTPLIELCSQYFDVSKMEGYEFWSHNNSKTNVGWHVDRDEVLFKRTEELVCPIASIVCYPTIEDLQGGHLLIKDVSIEPKTNRVVFFGPEHIHMVEPYSGNRLSVLVNIFRYKTECPLAD